jgi:hypothetical protein
MFSVDTIVSSRERFGAHIKRELSGWAKIVKDNRIERVFGTPVALHPIRFLSTAGGAHGRTCELEVCDAGRRRMALECGRA